MSHTHTHTSIISGTIDYYDIKDIKASVNGVKNNMYIYFLISLLLNL